MVFKERTNTKYDVVIVGSGPNGLSAGISLQQQGLRVVIVEASKFIGGGTRTAELTLPKFKHDVCSAIHPMGYSSPFFKKLPLKKFGLEWIVPEASVAHPLENEPAVILSKSIKKTAENLGVDAKKYIDLVSPFVSRYEDLLLDSLKPLGFPKNPSLMAKFGLKALQPSTILAKNSFKTERAKALFAGCAAHSVLPLDKLFTSAIGLMFLITAHIENWSIPKGGSQSLADALAGYYLSLGGEFILGEKVNSITELPLAKKYIFDTDPKQLATIASDKLPNLYKKRLKKYEYGPGVFKIDYALSEKIPWKDINIQKASTVHIGGTLDEIAKSEKDAWNGKYNDRPFVFVGQQSNFDSSRAPDKNHTGWVYCHVPFGSTRDMTKEIEKQIETYAPNFKDIILERHVMNTKSFHSYNPNYFGGAVTGGAANLPQLFTRPVFRFDPYSTPNSDIYICSASTPPGGGVHGMCGFYAAQSVLKSLGINADKKILYS